MALRITLEDGCAAELPLTAIGARLSRPESVLATSNGDIWAAHWDGAGVSRIAPDGSVCHHLPHNAVKGVHPNGICLMADGSFLMASLGETGGIWRLTRDRDLIPFLTEVDGTALPPANFVSVDRSGRVWVSVSTRKQPRALGYRGDVADGFLVVVDSNGARIATDGLSYANEVLVSPCGGWLYVNETFGRRLSRFPISDDGKLGARENVVEFADGIFPDGLGFDEEGGVWVVSIVSNTVLRIGTDGDVRIILSDHDPDHVRAVECAFQSGTMGRPHLDDVASERLRNVSSIAFAGPDRRTAVLGCLLGDRLETFRSPLAGVEPVHWQWNVALPDQGLSD